MENVMKQSLKKGTGFVVKQLRDFKDDESGMGTIEVVLILVVLIGLVITFKGEITRVLQEIMSGISTKASAVYR